MVTLNLQDRASSRIFPPPRKDFELDRVRFYYLDPQQPQQPEYRGTILGDVPLVNAGSQGKPRWLLIRKDYSVAGVQSFEYVPQHLSICVFLPLGLRSGKFWLVFAYCFSHIEHYVRNGERLGRDRRGIAASGFDINASIPNRTQVIELDTDGPYFPTAKFSLSLDGGANWLYNIQPAWVMLVNIGHTQPIWRLFVRGELNGPVLLESWSCRELLWPDDARPRGASQTVLQLSFKGRLVTSEVDVDIDDEDDNDCVYSVVISDEGGIWDFCIKLNYTTSDPNSHIFPVRKATDLPRAAQSKGSLEHAHMSALERLSSQSSDPSVCTPWHCLTLPTSSGSNSTELCGDFEDLEYLGELEEMIAAIH